MISKNIPRIIIGGTSSGCGKTTITCAILQALVNRGIKTASFKCGPDYIDTMFHGEIIGAKSSNLDAFFCDDNTIKYLLCKNSINCDISVIEGVMGFYDGINLNTVTASTYDISKKTSTPAILIVNCKGMSNSAIALIKGFAEYKENSNIVGVILNNTTKNIYQAIRTAIELEFNQKIEVLGFIPKLPEDLIFESRHLGLITAGEVSDMKEKLDNLANIVEETVDLDKIIEIASSSLKIEINSPNVIKKDKKVKIAVAYDKAFCFYYKDNLELLEEMGAEIAYFSPLNDIKLPENIDGLYLGGGYPELYCEKLSQNISMLKSIKSALETKIPCIAECGGFMYLLDEIDGCKMVGFFDGKAENAKKLTRFGYISLTAEDDSMLCKKGEVIKAHEFHYYDSTACGGSYTALKQNGIKWKCIFAADNLYAGYPHLHFYSNIKLAENFYNKCESFKCQKNNHE